MIATLTPASRLPGPPELLPGRPDAVIDLQTADGVALVGGAWRYADARIEEVDFVEVGPDLGPSGPANRTYDVVPHAEAADYDDSAWTVLAPEDTRRRLAGGRVCFNWYRIAVTIPERVGGLDPTGATVVFEVTVDDAAEVWVDGRLPHALGDAGGPVTAGFNAPNRVVLTRDARPGQRFQIAVFGINGPISASPANYIWLRTATLDLYAPGRARGRGRRPSRSSADAGARRPGATRRPARAGGRRLRVHRGPRVVPGRRAALQLAQHERDLPVVGRRRAADGLPQQERLRRPGHRPLPPARLERPDLRSPRAG